MRALVFDMDGVIFDSERITVDCWQEVLKRHGFTYSSSVVLGTIGMDAAATGRVFRSHYGYDFRFEELREERKALFDDIVASGGLPVKPGVYELIDFLKSVGMKIGLATSTQELQTRDELRAARLYDSFDAIITGDMVNNSKPAPDIFLKACGALEAMPCDAYCVEDSINGITAAHSAGMKPIMVPDLLPPTQKIRDYCVAICPKLDAVIDIVKFFS